MQAKMKIKQDLFFVHTQAGAGMIEVLVAIIILSIGLLGLAGLQTAGLKSNQGASFRSTASIMAYNILDSMRANQVAAGAGGYNHSFSETETETETKVAVEIPVDIETWLEELALRLPAGNGAIDIGADNKVIITIQWDDSRGELAAQQLVMTTRL